MSSEDNLLSENNSRRSFIKKVTLGGVAASLANGSGQIHAAGSAKLRSSSEGETFRLQRDIPVNRNYEVIVAGGGPAGVAAAVSAARLGAKVILFEGTGCLGGMGSSGLVSAFDPMANGKEQLVRGFMGEVVELMHEEGYMNVQPGYWRTRYHAWSKFNPEGYKLILDRMVVNANVTTQFYTKVIEAEVDSAGQVVKGVVTSNVEGMTYYQANTFIDCTGDAVLADLCGADCWEAGRDTEKIMPPTMPTLWSGELNLTRGEVRKLYERCVREGKHRHPSYKFVGLSEVDDGLFYLNGGHLFDMNALKIDSVSEGAMRGRIIAEDFRRMFEEHPEIKLTLAATSSLIGVRESRRIKGEYVFNENDMKERRLFADTVGVYCKACDIHPYAFTKEAMKDHYEMYYRNEEMRPGRGEMFAIPYGALVPKGWKNLWTAGRCASADIFGQGSLRCQPYCSQMGQAAGTAAVQTLERGETADNLNTEQLVKTLRQQNVYLPQEKLSPEMTR